MIFLLKKIEELLKKINSNPYCLFFSFILTVIGTWWGFYTYYNSEKIVPYYTIISDNIITSNSSDSRIKILYKKENVQNVRMLQIALWNEGSKFIEKSDFLSPYIAKIKSDGVRVMEADIVSKSRKELDFEVKIDTSSNDIQINLKNNEVIENNDGLLLKVYYTSIVNKKWQVYSRIKGYPLGFVDIKKDTEKIEFIYNILLKYEPIIHVILFSVGIYSLYVLFFNSL